jgi:uncharacterized protein (TIGR02001 family)
MLQMKLLAAAIAGIGLVATAAQAQDEAKSPFTGNVTFVTNYVVRGVSQTNFKPALQGTIEYAHSSGVYLNLFGSNVSWLSDGWEVDPSMPAGGSAYGGSPSNALSKSLEIDVALGWRTKFLEDFTFDGGFVYYYYPGVYRLDKNYSPGLKEPNTAEVYAALGWKWFTLKVNTATTDGVFMVPNAAGTSYINLGAAVPIAETGFTVFGGVGTWLWQGEADYLKAYGLKNDVYNLVDYKVGVSKDYWGLTFSLTYWGSTADKTAVATGTSLDPGRFAAVAAGTETAVWGNRFGKNIGDDTVFFGAAKAF